MPKSNRPATSGYARLAQEEEDRANDPYDYSDDDDLYHTSSAVNPNSTQYEPISTRHSMPSAATPPEYRRRSSGQHRRGRRNSGVDIKAINARLERWAEEIASKFKIHRVRGKTLEEEKLEIYHSVFQPPNGVQPITAEELDSEEVELATRSAREGFEEVVESVRLAIELGMHPRMISQGSSGSYFARNSEGKVVGVFKPKDEEPYASRNPKWTKWIHRNLFPCFFGRACLIPNLSYVSEAAAYVLDSRLRTNLVPYTDIVWLSSKSFYYDFWDRRKAWMGKKALPPKAGSFQVFLKGYRDANLFLREHPWPDQTNPGFRAQDAPKRKKRPWNEACRPSGIQSDDEDEEEEYTNGHARTPSPREESREQQFHWTENLKQSFREELEKLVILDYIMRNTDRGLDNWMIKIDWKTEEVSIVAEPPKKNEPEQDDDDHLVPPRPVSVTSDQPVAPSYPYRRHEAMVAVSRTGTPLNSQEPQATIHIGAIDNSLSWPWKHPDAWRSFPFGWLFLPVSLIGQPFSQKTRDHFLPLLTSTAWWSGTQMALRRVFSQDDDFKESMFARQIAVMKGQAWNVVETLKQPDHGPLELTRRTRVCVWDDLVDVPVAIPLRGPSTEAQRRKIRGYDDRFDPDNEEMDISAAMSMADQDLMGLASPPRELPNPNRFELSRGRNSRDSGRPETASTTDYGFSRNSVDILSPGRVSDQNWPSLPPRPGNKHQKKSSISSARGQSHLIWSSDDLEGDLGYAAAEGMEGNQRKVIVERLEALQKNGNDPDAFPPWPLSPYGPSPALGLPDAPCPSLSLSFRRSPTPPEDPDGLDLESSLVQTLGQQGGNTQQRSAAPPISPQGTSSVAHRLLSPQRPPSAHRGSSIGRSQVPSSARTTSANLPPRTVPQVAPDIDVQFTNTADPSGSDGKRSVDLVESEDDVDSRHASLIEDMYGVERRTGTLYKRLKSDKNSSQTVNRGPFTGSSGLGEYMKEDEGEKSSSAAITPDVVDLTLDTAGNNDDDDLQVTGSNNLSVQRVCYGKLENAMVQATLVPKPDPKTQTIFGDSAHDWPSMKLGVHRQVGQENNRIDVSDPHGKVFGAVDAKTAAVIVPLLDSPAMKVDITARLDVRKKLPHEAPWSPCSSLYRASINLYGLRQDAERVGNHLGRNNVWLATPFSVEQGVPVFNPHAERRRLQTSWAPTGAQRSRVGVNYEVRSAEEVTDAVMKMFDQLQSADNLPEMEPPSLVTTPLLRHQKQALWFMTEKENPRKFGPKEEDNNSLWRIQHRSNGAKQYREIISGIVLDEEPPQSLGGLLADMMGLGKTLSILSLALSTLKEAGEWAEMIPPPDLVRSLPGIRNTKTTLLVVPLSTVNNWVSQIKEHLQEGALSAYVFHGSSRTTNVDELSKYDLVITTYSIVLSELSGRGSKRAGMSPLMKMNMFRIVLDEAHTIREQSAAQTQAIFKLHSQRHWSVTGTPIQNRLEDLLSVTKFLGLFPYDDRSRFGLYILSRFKTGDATVLASLRVLVDSFTLRRVKDKIDLPARHDKIVMLDFTESERQLHEFFRKESNKQMKGRMYHHILKAMMILRQISAHGKELLDNEERVRIKGLSVQDAIDLEEGPSEGPGAADKKAYEMFTLMQDRRLEEPNGETNGAAAPGKPATIAIVLPCLDQAFDSQTGGAGTYDIKCSVCDGWIPALYSTITTSGLQDYLNEQAQAKHSRKQAKTLGEYEGPHTKTKALLSHLLDTAEQSAKLPEGEPPIKSVIALRDHGLTGFTRLDGTMTLAARNKALDTFRDDDSITVLLATIGAGGVGLNLTAASHVYIMEPQYNPAATREVTTVQFLMKESIEEKIFELAKKKQQLADMSLNRGKLDKTEVQEQRMREYRSLFK
ncbi:SNF2 family N-terminal domain-containing protein [Aspergillus lucknowensis]|uniref:1-phosphatidylinositol 4-kinase n=1 Tax=Aspergillus lucknowensis TaxID=176173 RepID=A0ABR4M8A3_9EURO